MPFVAPASSYTATQFVCRCHRTRKGLSTEFYRESCVRSLFFSSFLSRGQLNACVCVHLYILYIRGRAPAEARSGTRQNGGAQTNNKILIYWNMTTFLYSVSMLQYTQRTEHIIIYDMIFPTILAGEKNHCCRLLPEMICLFIIVDIEFVVVLVRFRSYICFLTVSFEYHIFTVCFYSFFSSCLISLLCVCVMFCIFTFVVVRSLIASHFNLFNFN